MQWIHMRKPLKPKIDQHERDLSTWTHFTSDKCLKTNIQYILAAEIKGL